MTLIHHRLINQLLKQPSVILPRWSRCLRHVHRDDFFLGVDPKKRPAVAAPHEFAGGAGDGGHARAGAHGKAQAESVAGRIWTPPVLQANCFAD